MTPSQLAAYYVGLIIMQYFGMTKASGMISAFVTEAIADLIVFQVRSGFSLAGATGRQLDALAEIVGVQRSVPGFLPGQPEFAMPPYDDVDAGDYIGFARYDDNPVPNGHWARYSDSPTQYVLTDGQLSQLIQFVIAVRASNYSIEALSAIFYDFFSTLVTITDNGDMSVTYTHDATNDPSVFFALVDYLELLPHPGGVQVVVVSI